MKWIYKAERKFGRLGINNLMTYIVVTMAAVFLMDLIPNISVSQWIYFDWNLIMQGQVWRLVSFIFLPPSSSSVILIPIAMMVYYFIGNSLENSWGSFFFTLYYLVGVIGTIIAGIACYYLYAGMLGGAVAGYLSGASIGNGYLNTSLFFAFACLFPDSQFRLMFLFPIKAKHLAMFEGALYFIAVLRGPWATRLMILAALANFFLFFGPDLFRKISNKAKYAGTRRQFKKQMKDNNPWR